MRYYWYFVLVSHFIQLRSTIYPLPSFHRLNSAYQRPFQSIFVSVFVGVLPHVSLWQRAWQRTCFGCGVFDVPPCITWKITGEAVAGVTASGNGTKDEATAVGCPLFLDMGVVWFVVQDIRRISESDEISMIWVYIFIYISYISYIYIIHIFLRTSVNPWGLWRAKANGQVPALKISSSHNWKLGGVLCFVFRWGKLVCLVFFFILATELWKIEKICEKVGIFAWFPKSGNLAVPRPGMFYRKSPKKKWWRWEIRAVDIQPSTKTRMRKAERSEHLDSHNSWVHK